MEQNIIRMNDAVLDEEQVVVIRSKALSLLKSKMKRSRSVRGTHSQHKQLAEDQPESAAAHQDENGASRRSEDEDESVMNQSTAAGGPDRSPDEEEQRATNTPLRSESSCNQREEESELSIAQLKQQIVVVYDKRRTEPSTHSRASPPATTTSCGCIESSQGTSTPAPEIVSEPAQQPQQQQETAKSLTKLVVKWSCGVCKRECIPIREESRCLCGHRYKEHPSAVSDPRVKNKTSFRPFACTSAKCACKKFFYVVAEGAWILRCRCKHKHIEHDPNGAPFKCSKLKCGCSGFDSPWICNCNHPWAEHSQETVEKQLKPLLERFQEQCEVQELCAVQRTDLLAEPLLQF